MAFAIKRQNKTDFTLGLSQKISLLSPLKIGSNIDSSAAPAADCQLFSHVQSHLNYYIYII